MAKNKNKRIKEKGFFRKCSLMLRCIIASLSFGAFWVGIALHASTVGIFLIVIGALMCALSIFANIIVPFTKLKF